MPYKDPEQRKDYKRKYARIFYARHQERMQMEARKRTRVQAGLSVGHRFPLSRARKKTPKATVIPTGMDLTWAAGFLEGEGSFGVHGHGLKATATQISREPLEHLVKFFGGTIFQRNDPSRPPDKQMHAWVVCGPRAAGVIMTLYKFMSSRRQTQMLTALWKWGSLTTEGVA